jgi:hypothetical protein
MKADDLIKLLRSCAATSCPAECPYASDLDTCECRIMNAAADALEDYRRKISVMIGLVLDLARDEDIDAQVAELCDPTESRAHRVACDRLLGVVKGLTEALMEKGE